MYGVELKRVEFSRHHQHCVEVGRFKPELELASDDHRPVGEDLVYGRQKVITIGYCLGYLGTLTGLGLTFSI